MPEAAVCAVLVRSEALSEAPPKSGVLTWLRESFTCDVKQGYPQEESLTAALSMLSIHCSHLAEQTW